jgi:hypothetical protein
MTALDNAQIILQMIELPPTPNPLPNSPLIDLDKELRDEFSKLFNLKNQAIEGGNITSSQHIPGSGNEH